MKFLCRLGVHIWQPDADWGARQCRFCQHVEVRFYTREKGMYWERIT